MNQKLLTIAIPTYNRAVYLDKCLDSIISQVSKINESKIEVIISNNASTDNSYEIINRYATKSFVKIFTNDSNIGADRNINNCYENSNGKYVWIIGDDDFLLPGYLQNIIELLEEGEYGVIHINYQSFVSEKDIIPVNTLFEVKKNITGLKFIERIHFYLTFISSHIFNKNILLTKINTQPKFETNLIQVEWYLTSLMEVNNNAIVENKILASKADNSGGYKLVTTFAENFNTILKFLIKKNGYPLIIRETINRKLLMEFFPFFLGKRLTSQDAFVAENEFRLMFKNFSGYKDFWKKIIPLYIRLYIKKLRNATKSSVQIT